MDEPGEDLSPPEAVDGARLFHACDPETLDFGSTEELEDLSEAIGQARALQALQFGVGMRHEGYNLFVLGSTGLGKHTFVLRELERRAAAAETPPDWCYVNNFEQPHRPQALRLPAGTGRRLKQDMDQLVEDLRNAIPAAFQSDDYRTRAQEINDALKERQEQAFSELDAKATAKGVTILRTPTGYTMAPVRDGELVGPEEFDKLPKDEQQKIEGEIEVLRQELREIIRRIPTWQRESRAQLKQLNQEVTRLTVDGQVDALEERYRELGEVLTYLHRVKQDVIENADAFRETGEESAIGPIGTRTTSFNRYRVNVLVDNAGARGAPVVYEDNPTYLNLIGRVEHQAQLGTLLTDFTLIKPGALHRANGGYLILDAREVLMHGFAWDGLKRALRSREIRIESLEQMLSLASTISLQPEPVPIDVKVVLSGERILYYLLRHYDPELGLLFKVAADFAEDLERSDESTRLYARLIATLQRHEDLRALERSGVARIIEHCARMADDAERLSLHMGGLTDLLRESDYWAGESGSELIRGEHVARAIDARRFRLDQLRERMQDSILRGIQLVDTEGRRIAQVNGLSVVDLGDHRFGRPSRITATARIGEGEVVDIEREVELGGSIHSKGVLILSSYLAHRYAQEQPLSLAASLVFEQSYGMVEGDSASVAELCALLSALGEIPLSQALAVTGSVNQHGEVQAIGGVNEKIEGFFDVCMARGLGDGQGVIIPASNVGHLMLRADVVEAAREGRFAVYPVCHVEQAMALLSGLPAGRRDADGRYPESSFNGRVQARLARWFELRKQYAAEARARVEPGDDAVGD
ncbi:MAG: ATP-binding protein [Thiohalocapsa sp.]|jgi:lon-related putative ATP-dependent protease